ncbi:MAG TPA: alpha/beta hydrolase [Candidatus Nanopelagicaceae bacterium]
MKARITLATLVVLAFSALTAPTYATSTWTLKSFESQSLIWQPCNSGFECTQFKVPVDYNHIDSNTFTLQVIKHDANKPTKRIGSLIMNPGGPGGSGIEYVLSADSIVSTSIENVYDLIGFDPRGVNLSQPIRCLTNAQEDYFLGGDGSVQNKADLTGAISGSKLMANLCAVAAGNKLGHYSTLETAKDMEILRILLKEPKLNYIGKSYGTFLGTIYAALYPKTTGRIVLDGAVDPNISVRDQNLAQAVGFDTALKSYVAANTMFSIKQIQNFLQQSRIHPISDRKNRKLSESLVSTGIAAALYDPTDGWPLLSKALAGAITNKDPYYFFLLADSYDQRDQSGHYVSNQTDIAEITSCLDFKDPRTLAQIAADAKNFSAAAPIFGPYLTFSGMACLYWHAKPVVEPNFKNLLTNPLLVIGTTRDPATPYQWAEGLHKDLLNSTLITLNGDGHTGANRGSSCVDGAMNTYLLTGKPPVHDITCDTDAAKAASVSA